MAVIVQPGRSSRAISWLCSPMRGARKGSNWSREKRIGVAIWPNGPSSGWSSVTSALARGQLRVVLDHVLASCTTPPAMPCGLQLARDGVILARGGPGGDVGCR